jgi:hypothetical protein
LARDKEEPVRPGEDRRSFLSHLAKTLAAGLGLALVPHLAASASAGQLGNSKTPSCAIVCSPTSDCSSYPCGTGKNRFHCVTECGYNFDACLAHSCSTYCYSQNIC